MELLFVLLLMFHLHTGACAWSVHVDQRQAVLRSGDRHQVRCWATGCGNHGNHDDGGNQLSDRAAVTWSIMEDRPMPADLRVTGGQEVTALFDPVTIYHEATYICRGRCGAQSRQLTTKIHVYSFPEDPVIQGHELLEAGQEATLSCAVNHLYPGELATVHWLRGGGHAPLYSQSGEAVGGDNTVGSAYTFTPGREDAGSDITCRVTLDLEGIPAEEQTRETTVTVTIKYSPEIVSISDSVRVRVGSAVTLSCEATGSPEPLVHWSFIDTAGWTIPLVPPVRTPDLTLGDVGVAQGGVYVCHASNLAGNQSANVTVTVLAPPVNTSLSMHPEEAKEGDSVTFTCQSSGSSSPEGWSLVLSRRIRGEEDEEEESRQIMEVSDRSSSVSVTLSAVSMEDSGVYQCEAENQHGSQLVTKKLYVQAHPLKVLVLPATTTVSEMGSDVFLSCRAMGCPHSATMSWSRVSRSGQTDSRTEGQVLMAPDPSQRPEDSLASSLAPEDPVSPSLGPVDPVETTQGPEDPVSLSLGPGDPVDLRLGPVDLSDGGIYVCQAQCGSVIRTNTTTVQVFSFPSDPVVTETQGALLRCAVSPVYAANQLLRFQWLSGSRELGSEVKRLTNQNVSYEPTNHNVSSELTYSPDERPEVVTCRVSLLTAGEEVWRVRETNVTLSVHSPPVDTSLTVHPEEVMEGHSVTFTCHSSGGSSPEGRSLVLRRVRGEESKQMKVSSSSSVSVTLSAVSMEDSGVYQCEAENQYGSTLVTKTLYVKAPPRNTTVEVLPSTVVQEGQNVTVCCRSVSFPPPAVVRLRKLTNGTELRSADGTFLLVNVTAKDTGLYQVNVTNELGFETEVFTISVMERTTSRSPGGSLASVLIPSVSVFVGLLCSAAVLEHMRRAKKKGFYQLAKPASTAVSTDASCDASSA